MQAQDRSFRYGQKRHVVVFRLLAAGSLEELVYSRQIYKQQLSNIAVSGKMEKRYFEGVQVLIDGLVFKSPFHLCNYIILSIVFSLSTSFASLQDCKEFQGELFGICNLFGDLSDKLFTSEIIEMHEKQGKDPSTQTNLNSPKINDDSSLEEVHEVPLSGKFSEAASRVQNIAKLDDLGKPMIYNV